MTGREAQEAGGAGGGVLDSVEVGRGPSRGKGGHSGGCGRTRPE